MQPLVIFCIIQMASIASGTLVITLSGGAQITIEASKYTLVQDTADGARNAVFIEETYYNTLVASLQGDKNPTDFLLASAIFGGQSIPFAGFAYLLTPTVGANLPDPGTEVPILAQYHPWWWQKDSRDNFTGNIVMHGVQKKVALRWSPIRVTLGTAIKTIAKVGKSFRKVETMFAVPAENVLPYMVFSGNTENYIV